MVSEGFWIFNLTTGGTRTRCHLSDHFTSHISFTSLFLTSSFLHEP